MLRTVNFRFKVIRNGADYGRLFPLDGSAPTIRMNDDTDLKTSLSGDFVEDPASPVDWLTDEIQPILVIDGEESPLGVFLPATVVPTFNGLTNYVHVEAYDRAWRVKDNYTESLVYYPAGTAYMDAIKQLLTACGIALVIETPSTATLAEAREDWDIGTSYLKIINQLLSEINYNPLWFNGQGAAVLEPVSVPTAENIEHTLDSDKVESLMVPAFTREMDIYQAPNVFVCVCSNPDKSGPMVATAENTNPQSPLSIMRRGRRIVSINRLDNIASQEELEAYAETLRNNSMFSGETVVVTTGLLPGFGVADVTALHFEDYNAICIERAWEMNLTIGGDMRHELERVVVNLG